MENRLSVAVVGIPINVINVNNDSDDYNEVGSYFQNGLTDRLRIGTKRFIKKQAKENNSLVRVDDLGELVDVEYSRAEPYYIPKEVFEHLARRLIAIVRDFDLVLVYGGVHSAAFVLYYLSGRIDRFDIHDDAQEFAEISPSTYLWHAIYSKDRVKHPNHVSHHGRREVLNYNEAQRLERRYGRYYKQGLPTERASGAIFDIDVDYYMCAQNFDFRFSALDVREEEIRVIKLHQAVGNAKPKVIGMFEYQRLDGSERGYRRILQLAWEGVKVRTRKV